MTWSTYPWVRPKKGHSPHQDFRMEQLQHQQTRISIEFHRYPPVWFMKLWKGFTAEFLPIGETTSQPWLSTAELKALLRIIWIRPVANSHPTHCLGLQTFFVPDQRFCARLAVCLIEKMFSLHLVGGFNHLEKYESQWEGLSHIWWKIKVMFETTSHPLLEAKFDPISEKSKWIHAMTEDDTVDGLNRWAT